MNGPPMSDIEVSECRTIGGVEQFAARFDRIVVSITALVRLAFGCPRQYRPIWRSGLQRTFRPGLGCSPPLIDAGLLPELTGGLDRIDASVFPPGCFVTDAAHQPVMNPTERDRELVAGLATEHTRPA